MKTRKALVGIGILCLFALTAKAEWERTICAWDTRLPAQGKLQMSLWGSYWDWKEAKADAYELTSRLYINYGLLDNWSVCVAPGYMYWDVDGGGSEKGIRDTHLMSTYRFLDEAEAGFDMALFGELWMPTGDDDKGLGTGSWEPGLGLIASKTLGPFIAVVNAGGSVIIDPGANEKDYILWTSLEGVYPLIEQLSVNAVFNASTKRYKDEDDLMDAGIGVRFMPIEQAFLAAVGCKCLTDHYEYGFQLAGGYEF